MTISPERLAEIEAGARMGAATPLLTMELISEIEQQRAELEKWREVVAKLILHSGLHEAGIVEVDEAVWEELKALLESEAE